MHTISQKIIDCFKKGGKIIVFGNGGSLADASHWSAEFNGIGSVIALNDPAKITSIGNDIGFKYIFSRQIVDLATKDDLIIGISSSGKSENVNWALQLAESLGYEIIDFPREGKSTEEVQNYQYQLLHLLYREIKIAYIKD